ncbi:MAG: exosortase-dependent surface protein XDP1 [Burkholderiales bacterium]
MKKLTVLRSAQIGVGAAALVFANLAGAATWDFANNGVAVSGSNSTSATVSGFAIANNSSGVINSGSTFAAASLSDQGGSGRGMSTGTDSGSPTDAIDNNGNTELMAINFGTKVDLDSVTIGWSSTDADISVLAYTGAGTPTNLSGQSNPIAGRSVSNLLANGWSLIGHYAGVASSSAQTLAVNASNITSSWWLVSAFNSGFGGNTSGFNNNNDYVKLLAVAGSACKPGAPGCGGQQVSEPATLALFGLAALGIVAVRRRNAA